MFYIALGFGLISLSIIVFSDRFYLWSGCVVFIVFLLAIVIIIAGVGFVHDDIIEINDSDYKVVSEYTIKDFSVTEEIDDSNTNKNVYEFTYSDGKKGIIKVDSTTKIKLSNNDNQQYTKLTVKEADVFQWATFFTKTYQEYVFS
jgi:hypothetical protein